MGRCRGGTRSGAWPDKEKAVMYFCPGPGTLLTGYWLGLASWVVVPEWQLTGGRRQDEWRQTGGERLRPTGLPKFGAGDLAELE